MGPGESYTGLFGDVRTVTHFMSRPKQLSCRSRMQATVLVPCVRTTSRTGVTKALGLSNTTGTQRLKGQSRDIYQLLSCTYHYEYFNCLNYYLRISPINCTYLYHICSSLQFFYEIMCRHWATICTARQQSYGKLIYSCMPICLSTGVWQVREVPWP